MNWFTQLDEHDIPIICELFKEYSIPPRAEGLELAMISLRKELVSAMLELIEHPKPEPEKRKRTRRRRKRKNKPQEIIIDIH